jgi:hypothetical protein
LDWLVFYASSKDNYFFDLSSKTNHKINLDAKVTYVKRALKAWQYIVDTTSWVYVYSTDTNAGLKNAMYDDVVVLDTWKILWIIKSTSKDKLSLLNFAQNWNTKIVLHDIETRDRQIIYESQKNIDFIFYVDWTVKYLDDNFQLFDIKELEVK